MKKLVIVLAVILGLLLLAAAGLTVYELYRPEPAPPPSIETSEQTEPPTSEEATTETTTEPETEPPETEPPETEPPFVPNYTSVCTNVSNPENWNVEWQVLVNGEVTEDYRREEAVSFGDESEYFALPGIATFRGGNYHQDASYGIAHITEGDINYLWNKYIGAIDPDWCGCGWTGQPLVVQWDEETKAIMNLYEDKKAKEGLTEVIYCKMDGYVHFFDIEDGSATRDPVFMGMVCKGSGAVDPRGYPIFYVGSGITRNGKYQTMFAISLIDGSIIHEWSGQSAYAYRWWFAFDSSPLIDGETDTMFWLGESGLLYSIKLNTRYDKAAGTLTMDPEEPVLTRYRDDYTRSGRYPGYEASITAVDHYLYMGDNTGMIQCVDANTMQLVWTQDLQDDINATPLFDWGEDGNGYLYTAPSTDYSGSYPALPITKLNARTGEVIWTHEIECVNVPDLPGGALGSPLLGRAGTDIDGLIIFAIGRNPNAYAGQVIALDKETGEVVWQFETDNYMWSSPVALYTEAGESYIFQADASGNCYLLKGTTGEKVGYTYLGCTVESSPIVFNDRVVLGTRSGIYLFKIT